MTGGLSLVNEGDEDEDDGIVVPVLLPNGNPSVLDDVGPDLLLNGDPLELAVVVEPKGLPEVVPKEEAVVPKLEDKVVFGLDTDVKLLLEEEEEGNVFEATPAPVLNGDDPVVEVLPTLLSNGIDPLLLANGFAS